MYKLLLCWRYLRTRWIALASIVSVTLGVATMIVVNSVMEGFRHEMQNRIHGILSDIVFESNSLAGFYDPDRHMQQIREVAGDAIEGMTPTVVVPAMLSYQYNGNSITRPVQLIGIDERTQSAVGDFCSYLQHPQNRERISFQLRENGYDVSDHQAGPGAIERPEMAYAGWTHRRRWIERQRMIESMQPRADRMEPHATGPYSPFPPPEQESRLTPVERPALEDPQPAAVATEQTPGATEQVSQSIPASNYRSRYATQSAQQQNDAPATGESPASAVADEENPLRGDAGVDEQSLPAGGVAVSESLPTQTSLAEPAESDDQPVQNAVADVAPDPATQEAAAVEVAASEQASAAPTAEVAAPPSNPFAEHAAPATDTFDPATQQHPGVVLGMSTVTHPIGGGRMIYLSLPGDDVRLSFPTAGTPPDITHASFTVVDLYESKMSEYDSSFVFVPIETLQQYRGMFDPETKIGYATSIQIRLKPGVDGQAVRDKLRAAFVPQLYSISTWRDKQGPLLAAVQMETAILNVLLFLIICVAGFGILAIFFMIVVEKTRDIGILKALGASRRGILGIFLGYGLSLGVVGAGAGMIAGLLFVAYINEIADLLGMITGQEVFDPSIYYFQKIPTIVEPVTISWIVLGSLVIAVLASVLPARRAARLHPVEALRYE